MSRAVTLQVNGKSVSEEQEDEECAVTRVSPTSLFLCFQAPFLDVLGTMENPSLPLTLEDREEWGDPVSNPTDRLSISSYCPLHNITPQVESLSI